MSDRFVRYEAVVIDGLGTPAALVSYLSLDDTNTLDQVAAATQEWGLAMDGAISGAFKTMRAVMEVPLDESMKAPTGPDWLASRNEQTGNLIFSATGTTRRYGQALPSVSNAVIVNGQVDITNAAIAGLIGFLLNPDRRYTNAEQQMLEAALDALLSFRKLAGQRRRGMAL